GGEGVLGEPAAEVDHDHGGPAAAAHGRAESGAFIGAVGLLAVAAAGPGTAVQRVAVRAAGALGVRGVAHRCLLDAAQQWWAARLPPPRARLSSQPSNRPKANAPA